MVDKDPERNRWKGADLAPHRLPRLVRTHLRTAHRARTAARPYARLLGKKLSEMRIIGKDVIARAICVAATGQRLVVVHAFVKKTSKYNQYLPLKRAMEIKG